ncbi:MAG: hypothetical protein JJT75_11590 [Opitutales bacterium]|nr:hypothetical protein [Opitutales bacterium]MCH8539993.1 hypothetical protein [Opitutales bacterium]
MNKQLVKETLSAFRHGLDDPEDPVFQEALAEVEKDPELQKWQQQAILEDQALRRAFNRSPAPKDLPEKIYAQHQSAKILSFPSHKQTFSAVAVAVILVAALFIFIKVDGPASSLTAEEFVSSTFALESGGHTDLDFISSDLDEKIRWLADSNAPTGWELPESFQVAVASGCSKVHIKNHPVSMVCYRLPEGPMAHIYVIKRDALSQATPPGEVHYDQSGDFSSARWCDGKFYYIAIAQAPRESLAGLFE